MARKPRDGNFGRPPRGRAGSQSGKPRSTQSKGKTVQRSTKSDRIVREKSSTRQPKARGKSSSTDEAALHQLRDVHFPKRAKRRKKTDRKASSPADEPAVPPEDPPAPEALSADELLHAVQNTAESLASQAEEAGVTIDPEATQDPAEHGQFLTSEELQTLGEVLGHIPDYPGHDDDDDPADLGVPPSSQWDSVQAEIQGLRSTIDGLQDAASEIGALKPLLAEIKSEVDVGHHRRDILTSSLSALSEDLHEVRLQISATSKSAVDSAASLREIHQQMNRNPGTVTITTDRLPEWPILLVGFGLLPLSWAVAFYLKTGDLRTALGGLVIANLAACFTLLFGRSRSSS